MGRARLKLEAVAYHEAGHAVVDFYVGQRFRYVTIVSDDDFVGHIKSKVRFPRDIEAYDFYRLLRFADPKAIGLLAGYFAQKKFDPRSAKRCWLEGWDRSEYAEIVQRIAGIDENAQRAYDRWVRIRAENLVERHWREIAAVADALMDRRRLTYEEVRDVIKEARGLWPSGFSSSDGRSLWMEENWTSVISCLMPQNMMFF